MTENEIKIVYLQRVINSNIELNNDCKEMNLLFCLFVAKIIRNFIIFLRLFSFCSDNPDKTTVVINKVSVKTIPLLADKISPPYQRGI